MYQTLKTGIFGAIDSSGCTEIGAVQDGGQTVWNYANGQMPLVVLAVFAGSFLIGLFLGKDKRTSAIGGAFVAVFLGILFRQSPELLEAFNLGGC